MLDQIAAHKNEHDQFIFLLIEHNMGLCYQKLGMLEECVTCLEKCLQHLDAEQLFFNGGGSNGHSQPALSLKLLKYKAKSHM